MKPDRHKEATNQLVISYLTLRNLIGLLGMLLPVLLVVRTALSNDPCIWKPSISDYYYTQSGDILVALLSAIAVFMFAYVGYNKDGERFWMVVASLGALGVAFFPTQFTDTCSQAGRSLHSIQQPIPKLFTIDIHFLSALLFFVAVAVISLFYFTKTDKPNQLQTEDLDTQKAKRNLVYKVCGWVIIACLITLGAFFKLYPNQPTLNGFPIILTLETLAVWAFGLSWITKGETLWPDNK